MDYSFDTNCITLVRYVHHNQEMADINANNSSCLLAYQWLVEISRWQKGSVHNSFELNFFGNTKKAGPWC